MMRRGTARRPALARHHEELFSRFQMSLVSPVTTPMKIPAVGPPEHIAEIVTGSLS